MSAENVEVVRRVLRRYSDQELDALLEEAHADIAIDYSLSDAPDGAVYRGQAACEAFLVGRYEDFAERSFETTALIDAPPDAVIALGRMRGKGRSSGIDVEAESVTVWTLRAGKVSHVKLYPTLAQAYAALGLRG